MDVRVRRAVPGDEERLALVGRAAFLEAFAGILDGDDIIAHCAREHAPSVYSAWLNGSDASIWIAETAEGATPVGYLVLTPPRLEQARADDLEVKRIYVLHRFHGLGMGSALMAAAAGAAKERGATRLILGVNVRNHEALAFYASGGFRKIGERRFRVGANHYDDVVLAMELGV